MAENHFVTKLNGDTLWPQEDIPPEASEKVLSLIDLGQVHQTMDGFL